MRPSDHDIATVTPLPSTLTLPDCSGFSTQWHFSRRQGSLVFMNGMDDLRPKIPTNVVSLIDALVEPLYRNMDRPGTVMLYQVTRHSVDVGGHR